MYMSEVKTRVNSTSHISLSLYASACVHARVCVCHCAKGSGVVFQGRSYNIIAPVQLQDCFLGVQSLFTIFDGSCSCIIVFLDTSRRYG